MIEGDGEYALKPEYIQINYNEDKQRFRATPRMFAAQPNTNNEK